MKLMYYRGRWPEQTVPDGAPEWLLYAVDVDTDCVLKTVEIYPDGKLERNHLALEARYGGTFTSLVEGSFSELASDWPLEDVDVLQFESLYAKSIDKPLRM